MTLSVATARILKELRLAIGGVTAKDATVIGISQKGERVRAYVSDGPHTLWLTVDVAICGSGDMSAMSVLRRNEALGYSKIVPRDGEYVLRFSAPMDSVELRNATLLVEQLADAAASLRPRVRPQTGVSATLLFGHYCD